MKRRTTTAQINEALTSNLLTVTKAEVYYKTSRETDEVTNTFLENFQFLCESGCFVDCVGWHYERDFRTSDYILEAGRSDAYSENIITIHMRVNEGVSDADVNNLLIVKEDET